MALNPQTTYELKRKLTSIAFFLFVEKTIPGLRMTCYKSVAYCMSRERRIFIQENFYLQVLQVYIFKRGKKVYILFDHSWVFKKVLLTSHVALTYN